MELVIKLVGVTSKQSTADFIALMLSEDAPLFEDEVDAEYHTTFEALSYFEQPEYIKVSGQDFIAQWELGGDAEYEEILLSLNEAGLDKIVAYINLDQAEKIVKCENDSLIELPFDSLNQLNKAENSQEREFEFLLSLLQD
ncbi:hypothetical protein [Pseudoalteromonas spongiae]|uniref:hypothetical protein n=1 Tax=Pseudoalteromonas spongiae TaxID=298657 RepID=UPI00110B1703|nr:hypothetical protein [Pseudoalteromonas spongiae]TMO87771.1 hypothetical protein CWC15_02855 [Pseudoalteromonas spongiae]